MSPLWLPHALLSGLAAILAGILSRRDRRHLPIAALLSANVLSDDVRALLGWLVIQPERGRLLLLVDGDPRLRPPLAGWYRAAFHVDEALIVAWSVGLVACAAVVFGQKKEAADPDCSEPAAEGGTSDEASANLRPRGVAVKSVAAWALVTAPLVALYPRLSGQPTAQWDLGRAYLAITAAGALGVILAAARGHWQRDRETTNATLLLLVAGETGALVAEIADPFQRWWSAQLGYCIIFAVIAAVHGRRLWGRT